MIWQAEFYATQVEDLLGVYYSFFWEDKKMNQYITGAIIKRLCEEKDMTQAELAELIGVSDKTISKWETGVSHS